jgi:hypothetical protein
MAGKTAKENYIKKRMNCAMSVADALKEKCSLSEEDIKEHLSHGGGNAPEGWCGAPYAAKRILEKTGRADKIKELEAEFMDAAGALECDAIRKGRKLSCIGCIEKAADFIANNCPKGTK